MGLNYSPTCRAPLARVPRPYKSFPRIWLGKGGVAFCPRAVYTPHRFDPSFLAPVRSNVWRESFVASVWVRNC